MSSVLCHIIVSYTPILYFRIKAVAYLRVQGRVQGRKGAVLQRVPVHSHLKSHDNERFTDWWFSKRKRTVENRRYDHVRETSPREVNMLQHR